MVLISLMNINRISLGSSPTNSSIDTSTGTLTTSTFPYYKPILASDARARTIPDGYHVSLC
jgi:hypothetical protein